MTAAAQTARPTGRALFLAAMAAACRPRKRLTVSQWADAHRRLTTKASSEAAAWRTARVPFMREIMDCLSAESPVRSVSFMKAAQIAGTEAALNWTGYVMHHAPAPMLVVVPTLDVRERWVKQRLDPMLTETPALTDLFDAKRKRAGTNTEGMKDYPGGLLIVGGANSPASLASMPIKYVINDELDRFPWEVGEEGDPHELVRARQRTFPRRKEFNVSTPTVKDASRIEALYLAGDQRRYHVPCPHCREPLVLHWSANPEEPQFGQLKWTLDPITKQPRDVVYVCGYCGSEIEEHWKPWMLENGRWVAKHPARSALARSYHLNSLYAPIGLGLRWHEMVSEWLAAQNDRTKLKVFINTVLGEPWEDRDGKVSEKLLAERAEAYGLKEIPPGCLLLTAAIDVQGDRLELSILGHGRGRRTWTVDYFVLPGDPARTLDAASRGEGPLIDYLCAPLANRFGKDLRIEATAIDTGGHHTQEVYNFVRLAKQLPLARRPRRLMAVKGANAPGKPILAGRPQAQDVNWRGKIVKNGVWLWMVGTDTAKSLLFDRLKSDAGQEASQRLVHFSAALPEDYYLQLTAERFDPEKNKWVKLRSRRNEALDLWVYAMAAAYHPEIRVQALRPADWQRLAQLLEPPEAQPADPVAAPSAVPEPQLAAPPGRRVISKGVGFVNRWKTGR